MTQDHSKVDIQHEAVLLPNEQLVKRLERPWFLAVNPISTNKNLVYKIQ